MDEKEMMETLSEVAKMKAQFELLKKVILRGMALDYYEKDLRLESDTVLRETMWILCPNEMEELFQRLLNEKKAKDRARQEKHKEVAVTKEDDING